jgi:gliding motility-associated-like protein
MHHRLLVIFILFATWSGIPASIYAQCNNWQAQASLTTGPACSPSVSFQIALSGPDVPNLSNIKYGIPVGNRGFSAPLQSSPVFSNMAQAIYKVSVVAQCNGVYVGRNTEIYVPEGYRPLALAASAARASLSCGTTGRITGTVRSGIPPYQFKLTSYPSNYAGRTTISGTANQVSFDSAPPGRYVLQVTDSCQSFVSSQTLNVTSVNESTIQLYLQVPYAVGCDSITVITPGINDNVSGWAGYGGDTTFSASVSIPGVYTGTAKVRMPYGQIGIKLPAGKSLKDCYGKQMDFTVYMPCGTPVVRSLTIPTPTFATSTQQHCDRDFDVNMYASGMICYPVQYSLRNVQTNQSYGPFTSPNTAGTAKGLPLGSYVATMTTADGFSTSNTFTVSPVGANPYSVSVVPGSAGLQGYAGGFRFSTRTGPSRFRSVELFSGPAGYVYSGQWYGTSDYLAVANTQPASTTLFFPSGSYVWKVTDECGAYYLTATVTAADMYSFAIDSIPQMETCQGLEIRPSIRSWRNGVAQPDAAFSLLLNGARFYTQKGGSYVWESFPAGSSVTLPGPGVYTVIASTNGQQPTLPMDYYYGSRVYLGFPNTYNISRDFSYQRYPLSVDTSVSQGFICPAASPGSGQIHITARDGFPFRTAGGQPYYKFSLAQRGSGVSGPYISTNTTGVFTGFNGPPDAWYDVKIMDSCGAFQIRQVRILDLGRIGMISNSEYVVCRADSLRLSALALPNASYSWTGPNGFSSGVRSPLIAPLVPASSGVYRVAINTSACIMTLRDTTVIAINNIPHKPTVAFNCNPRPPEIWVTNPAPGMIYRWIIGYPFGGINDTNYFFSSPFPGLMPYSTRISSIGPIAAVTIDTTTGCQNYSDTLLFDSDPFQGNMPVITSVRLNLCTGDTTTLIAGGFYSRNPKLQWFRNGQLLPGETWPALTTSLPGDYRFSIHSGVCGKDTSPVVKVSVIPPPQVNLVASDTVFCNIDTALLHTPHAGGYTYSWLMNGTTVPGAFDSSIRVSATGRYEVIVSNGACVVQSRPVNILVKPVPVLDLRPSADQDICPGETLLFNAETGPGISYAWYRDSVRIAGADSAALQVTNDGTYMVIARTPECSAVSSPAVKVRVLIATLQLPADTTICNDEPFTIPFEVNAGFSNIRWSTGSSDHRIEVRDPGLYWVQGENKCGRFNDSVRVRTYRDYLPYWPEDTMVCNISGSSRLSVPAILSNVRWSNGATGPSIIAKQAGRYWMEGLSPCGMVRDTIDLGFCPPYIRDLGIDMDTICVGECITPVASTGNYPVYLYWSMPGAQKDTGWGSHPGTYCYRNPGVYQVALRVESPGGSDSAVKNIVVASKPVPRFRDTALVAPYKTKVMLPACAEASHADWYRNDSLICSDCPRLELDASYYYNVYKCVVRNASCPDSCSYALRVIDIPHAIWLPDAFTPNGDGRNDFFGIITDNPNVQVINLEVYNRWGQRVFVSNLNGSGWDGSFAGRQAEMGTYHWQLRYRVMDKPDVTHYMKGDILLIR